LLFSAYLEFAAGYHAEALVAAEEAKSIYDSLNNDVGQTIGFWKINKIEQLHFPETRNPDIPLENSAFFQFLGILAGPIGS
jgi:hypothetical protein